MTDERECGGKGASTSSNKIPPKQYTISPAYRFDGRFSFDFDAQIGAGQESTSCSWAADENRYFPPLFETFLLTGEVPEPTCDEWKDDIPDDWREPAFIVGCGRSGTTLLGQLLSQHKEITYLNEARALWIRAVPSTDVWSIQAFVRRGSLRISEDDVDDNAVEKLRRLFYAEHRAGGTPLLLEKLPENAFRMRLLHRAFPRAKFIHIVRNGCSVASSISKFTPEAWYGAVGQYKWTRLQRLAIGAENEELQTHTRRSDLSMSEKGLVEWMLAVSTAREDSQHLPSDNFMEIRFEDLCQHPVEALAKLQEFLKVSDDPNVVAHAQKTIKPKKSERPQKELPESAPELVKKLYSELYQ